MSGRKLQTVECIETGQVVRAALLEECNGSVMLTLSSEAGTLTVPWTPARARQIAEQLIDTADEAENGPPFARGKRDMK